MVIAFALLTGFYLGIGFGGYMSARGQLRWPYNVATHILYTFAWGWWGMVYVVKFVYLRWAALSTKSE